jgi:hypothetical protein
VSQNGEDGIPQAIFAAVGTTNKHFVEFGVGNGEQCNTAYLAGPRQELRARGLRRARQSTWRRVAEQTLAIYHEAAS